MLPSPRQTGRPLRREILAGQTDPLRPRVPPRRLRPVAAWLPVRAPAEKRVLPSPRQTGRTSCPVRHVRSAVFCLGKWLQATHCQRHLAWSRFLFSWWTPVGRTVSRRRRNSLPEVAQEADPPVGEAHPLRAAEAAGIEFVLVFDVAHPAGDAPRGEIVPASGDRFPAVAGATY